MEEEAKEFANLNEGEERKAEMARRRWRHRKTGQRAEVKARGGSRDTGGKTCFHIPSIHMLSAGCCEPSGTGSKQTASSSSG